MKKQIRGVVLLLVLGFSVAAVAQPKRSDAIWARTAPAGSITIDGKLDEAVWAKAESLYVQYGKNPGLPGGGFTVETGDVTDSIKAVVKFLVSDSSLYVAVTVKDSSIGGKDFGPQDGKGADALLMNLKNKSDITARPSPHGEFILGWIKVSWMNPSTTVHLPGGMPVTGPNGVQGFTAAVTVKGSTNNDDTKDTSYTVEMRYNLKRLGYDISKQAGDIMMYSLSIRDGDWQWFTDLTKNNATFSRVWIQSPWGNGSHKSHLRIFARPDVTTSSGTTPAIMPDVTIPDGKLITSPVIDGKLDEPVWKVLKGFDIRFGSDSIRNLYSYSGPWRSGQYQPDVNGGKAVVKDPGDATVKWFFKGDTLYVGVDVRDKYVQYITAVNDANHDRADGLRLTINDKKLVDEIDNDMLLRKLTLIVDSSGKAMVFDDLLKLRDTLKSTRAAISLNAGTTVDTLGLSADKGYQIEMAIGLKDLGFPAGRGDGVIYLGATLYDGDGLFPSNNSYGTRTWFYREGIGDDGPAFAYMDPTVVLTSVGRENAVEMPTEFALLGNYPNPFNPSTAIKYSSPADGNVSLTVYDNLGRSVSHIELGAQTVGEHSYKFNASHLSSGVYFYQLHLRSQATGKEYSTPFGKMLLVK